jgi:hypothetical protein
MSIFQVDKEIAERGRFFIAWDNADRSRNQRIFARPVHRLVNGNWVEMDNRILGPWQFQVDGKVLDISLATLQAKTAEGAARELLSPDLATSFVDGNKVTYQPFPGIEIVYKVGLAGLKESIIVHSLPKLPEDFKSKWVTISGTLLGARGLVRKPATFTDAQGNEGQGYLVWNGDDFELGVDVAWIYAAPLPVVIDPTISCDGNDAYLSYQPVATRIYGKLFTKYDISSIPSNAVISAATTNHYCTVAGTSNNTVSSKRTVSQTWLETDSVTTLDVLTLGANLGSKTLPLTLNAWNSWNVRYGSNSDGIEADVSAGNQYFSPCLSCRGAGSDRVGVGNGNPNKIGDAGTDPPNTPASLTSSEGASNQPYLEVTWTMPPPPSARGFAVMV